MKTRGTGENNSLQLEQARLALGEALGQLQDLRDPGVQVVRIGRSIAAALQQIFQTQNGDLRATQLYLGLQGAINQLQTTLGLVCGVRPGHPTLDLVTSTVSASMLDLSALVGRLNYREPCPQIDSVPLGALNLVKKPIPRSQLI